MWRLPRLRSERQGVESCVTYYFNIGTELRTDFKEKNQSSRGGLSWGVSYAEMRSSTVLFFKVYRHLLKGGIVLVSVHLVSFLAPKRTFYEWQSSLIEKTSKFKKEGMINIKIIQNNINITTNNNLVPILELKIFHLIWVLIKGALFLSRSVVAAHSALKTSGEPISEIQYYKQILTLIPKSVP